MENNMIVNEMAQEQELKGVMESALVESKLLDSARAMIKIIGERNTLREENATLREENERLGKTCAEYKEMWENYEPIKEVDQTQEAEIERLKARVSELETELSDEREKYHELEVEKEELDEKISELEEENEKFEGARNAISSAMDYLSDLKDAASEIEYYLEDYNY